LFQELVSSSKHYVNLVRENKRRSLEKTNFPDSFDWRTKGVISPVKNQGVLGQASAFVAVGEYL
jgi:C1A family cysteine protease